MITIKLTHDGRVDLRADIEIPMSAARLWSEVADLPRFATQDFFHAEFEVPVEKSLAQGTPLIIRHRFLGVSIQRKGRILRYIPQRGYSFSDLSSKGNSKGFPHVMSYRIEPLGAVAITVGFGGQRPLDVKHHPALACKSLAKSRFLSDSRGGRK